MKKITTKVINRQEGATLLMSLLILSLTMASAVALSRIILGELRMTVSATNYLRAFYAADSAIEKGLYYVKYSRVNGDNTSFSSLYTEPNLNLTDDGIDLTFTQASTTIPSYISYDISTSTSAHVDIIDPAGDISSIDWDPSSTDDHYYNLTWHINSCYPYHASNRLEITSYSFASPFVTSVEKDVAVCNCVFGNDDCSVYQKSILDTRFYRFSFRPLDTSVTSILFEVYRDTVGGPVLVDTTANFAVKAIGKYKGNSYILKAEIPALAATSDIFSYVIFSEESLIKGF